jgi:eukaryotic-like serine/threonine-protein kinase
MRLAANSRLGPYEINASIGAGGMGEVYRAKDTRLGRNVAVKVLPPGFSGDPDRLRRFEQEARAAGALSHPNILTIHDIGSHEGCPYVVSELLEGETLRERLKKGPLPPRKAIEYALQVVRGLAAAHEKGITHRDLKPDNLFITSDGRVKILDFGLAKLTRREAFGNGDDGMTKTEPGSVLGTVGYMAPEQARGQVADQRSDIFSFGTILYEMLSGGRAFQGDSAVETMNAILKEDPPDLSETHPNLPPALDRIIQHCLEKKPEDRFQSARDLAFDLESLSSISASKTPSGIVLAAAPAPRRWRAPIAIAAAGVVLCTGGGYVAGVRLTRTPPPSFHQLTFRRGGISAARFAPDGQTIVYGASWGGQPVELFSTRADSPESRALGQPATDILAISPSGEMAISQGRRSPAPFIYSGTLARAPLAGGAAREVLENVQQADWTPDGTKLAILRKIAGRTRLECPTGKVLYESAGWISHPRVSPKGDAVAFLDHPLLGDDGGSVDLVTLDGKKRTLSAGWSTVQGLAWYPSGSEVWFTGTKIGAARAVHAVSLGGRERLVVRAPGILTLNDISRDGRLLLTADTAREGLMALSPGDTKERDLSWLDWSTLRDISADGKTVLFIEAGEGGGASYSVYIRKTDGSPAVRIGAGNAFALSPDGKWVLGSGTQGSSQQLSLLPTGPGEPSVLEREAVSYQFAAWTGDGKHIVVGANESGHGVRLYLQDLAGGKPKAISPEGMMGVWRSSDSRSVIAQGPDGKIAYYPLEGGPPREIPGTSAEDVACQLSTDGQFLYITGRKAELPTKVYRLNVTTGRRELWKEFTPLDTAGIDKVGPVHPTPDGKSYAYSYSRTLSDLYLVEGAK